MAFIIPDNDVSAVPGTQSVWYSTDIAILAAGLNGEGVISGCGVTAQGSPNMTAAVAAGVIRIASGLLVTVTSGNVTIGTADGSNPRIDLVSASAAGVKTVTAGTAAVSPKPPDLPSGHVALAMVDVPTSDTTISSGQITDKRVLLPRTTPVLLLDYTLASDIGPLTVTASTWVDIIANQNFIKAYDGSVIEIVVRAFAFVNGASGQTEMSTRVLVDEAGTPITEQLGGEIVESGSQRNNPFSGSGSVFISGLAAATHTIKPQINFQGSNSGFYCRPTTSPNLEFLRIQVIEHL